MVLDVGLETNVTGEDRAQCGGWEIGQEAGLVVQEVHPIAVEQGIRPH